MICLFSKEEVIKILNELTDYGAVGETPLRLPPTGSLCIPRTHNKDAADGMIYNGIPYIISEGKLLEVDGFGSILVSQHTVEKLKEFISKAESNGITVSYLSPDRAGDFFSRSIKENSFSSVDDALRAVKNAKGTISQEDVLNGNF